MSALCHGGDVFLYSGSGIQGGGKQATMLIPASIPMPMRAPAS